MIQYTRWIIAGGTVATIFVLIVASYQGWGLIDIRDKEIIIASQDPCPSYLRDEYGNCPPRNHRNSIGRRFMGGGHSAGK
jgi:hypothetical protein